MLHAADDESKHFARARKGHFCAASDVARRRVAQVGEAPEAATTPDAAGGAKKEKAAAAAPKAVRATPKRKAAPKALSPKAPIAKKAKAAPKAKATPQAKKAPSAAAAKAKPKATWAANPLDFKTGATDRAARAKAHRRGRA